MGEMGTAQIWEVIFYDSFVHLCIFIFVYLCICAFVYLCICVFVNLCICEFVYLRSL